MEPVKTEYYTFGEPPDGFELEYGGALAPVTLAYETYGALNAARDNVILVLHGFTAGAHAAGFYDDPIRTRGWWDNMIGPGKTFDTDRFLVVCSNVIGGCSGSTGPSSLDPKTGIPFGSRFPAVTLGDMTRAQKRLLDAIGIRSIACVTGASMGGMQTLDWVVRYPEFVRGAIPIACSARLSAQSLGICGIARAAILTDPDFAGGDYYGRSAPTRGLALARMAAHVTYVSAEFLESEFDHRFLPGLQETPKPGAEYAVQAYLRDEGERFIRRFDANSYLVLSQAIEHFDLTRPTGQLADAFRSVRSRLLLLSFSTDWLFPSHELEEIAVALRANGIAAAHETVATPFGHDAFLTDWQVIAPLISDFLADA